MDKNKEKSVSVRIPIDLLEEIRKVARQNNRSLNGEILTAMRLHVSQDKEREKNHDHGK